MAMPHALAVLVTRVCSSRASPCAWLDARVHAITVLVTVSERNTRGGSAWPA